MEFGKGLRDLTNSSQAAGARVTDANRELTDNCPMTPDSLRQMISDFLVGANAALVVEDGAVAFDLAESKYSISGEYNKCLLHLWSSERNFVRRVLDAEIKGTSLRLQVQRIGQNRPTKLDFFRDRDRRSPAARQTARVSYAARIQRTLLRHFPGWTIARLTSSMDLHRSFGPAYLRGLLQQGQRALAVVGVNEQETQSTVDGALTCGLLWLDACRLAQKDRRVVEGLAIILPKGTAALTQQRMAHLHPTAAKWQLHEFDEREDALAATDIACGNLTTRLVRATDEGVTCERFAESIAHIRAILPQCDFAVLSPAVISFRLRGLEFAQARIAHDPRNFQSGQEIVFGVGSEERVLDDGNEAHFIDLMRLAASIRHKDGPKPHPLWRMQPERWLESLVFKNLEALDGRLRVDCLYSQVPAFSGVDRAMIDVLALTRENRLAVVELKADEDIHLPLQGVDYWARVAWHQERDEFRKFGYFPGIELSPRKPLLLLVAPAFHVHPSTDAVLRYLSPEIEWELFGIDEHWREGVRVVFRKRASIAREEAVNLRSA
jgi:hypothetical protein